MYEKRKRRPSRSKRGYTDYWYKVVVPKQLKRQPYCSVCGSTENLQVDHRTPASLGGPSTLDNADTLCGLHNNKKGNR